MSLVDMSKPRSNGLKTYSRRKPYVPFHNVERAPKRRRVESSEERLDLSQPVEKESPENGLRDCETISPESNLPVASYNISGQSTPPSSPPQQDLSTNAARRRTVFSFLGRPKTNIRSASSPLEESTNKVSNPLSKNKKTRLVQMRLDLGGSAQIRCKICGMEYVPSNPEDTTLHKKFHAKNIGGIDMNKAFLDTLRRDNKVGNAGDGDFIAVISRKDTSAARKKAQEVLEVVTTELGAVPITSEDLWSRVSLEEDGRWKIMKYDQNNDKEKKIKDRRSSQVTDRYKVYLYIHAQKCIGLCLVERISHAYDVLGDVNQHKDATVVSTSSSITVGKEKLPALMGVSRIWSSSSHRKNGNARALLDCATENFMYGINISKEMVAFSQPTESGGRLARKWFAMEKGWKVYSD